MSKKDKYIPAKPDKKNIEDIIALTPGQEGMLFHYLLDKDDDQYFEQLCLEVSGKIDWKIFTGAWNFVVETNEMLRTVYRWENLPKPLQIVLKRYRLKIKCVDCTGSDKNKNKNKKKQIINELKIKDRKEKFDLREIPFRVTLGKIEENEHVMIISNHHILFDGWSLGIILKEFFDAYNTLFDKKKPVKPVKKKFSELIKWSQNQDRNKLENYWRDYFKGFDGCHNHGEGPLKKGNIKGPGAAEHYRFGISRALTTNLHAFARTHKFSLAALLYGLWAMLLYRYNGCKEVIFDTTVSGRPPGVKGVEDIVGLFINTLPFRVQVFPHNRRLELLRDINRAVLEREKYELTPLDVIDEYRPVHHGQLFDSVVVIENYPLDKLLFEKKGALTVNGYSSEEVTRYDLTVIFSLVDDIKIDFTYDKNTFTGESISKMSNRLIQMLEEITANPGKTAGEIELLSKAEVNGFLRKMASQDRRNRQHRQREIFAVPGNRVEAKLLEIWSLIFGLEKQQIGIYADFFREGGNSLKALHLISRVKKEFGVNLSLPEIFRLPTIKELSGYIKDRSTAGDEGFSVKPVEKREYYGLSSGQKRLYSIYCMDKNSTNYNIQLAFRLAGPVEKDRLEDIFNRLIDRHDSLRTSFRLIGETVSQKIHAGVDFKMACYNVDEKDVDLIIDGFRQPFDLSAAPLLRVGFIRLAAMKYVLVMDMHHIAADGLSMEILTNEFTALYKSSEKELPGLRLQYKDYVQWQYKFSDSGDIRKQEKFWLETFNDGIPLLNLPVDFPRPPIRSTKGNSFFFRLDRELTARIKAFILESGVTLYMFILAVYTILLAKHCGQEDIIVGSPVSGRRNEDFQPIIGLFANILAVRNKPRGRKIFGEFLKEVKINSLNALNNQDYQFENLVTKLNLQGKPDRHPIFDTVFGLFDIAGEESEIRPAGSDGSNGIRITPYPIRLQVVQHDLTLEAVNTGTQIKLALIYSTALFKPSTIRRFSEHLLEIIEQIIMDREVQLGDIALSHEFIAAKANIIKNEDKDFRF